MEALIKWDGGGMPRDRNLETGLASLHSPLMEVRGITPSKFLKI